MSPGTARPAVRVMRPADTAWTARAHARLLPHGLFPRLGERFVRRWHVGHVWSPYGVALVAEVGGRPVGFLVGSTDHRRHIAWTLNHDRMPLSVLGLLGLAARPPVLVHFLRTRARRYSRRVLGGGGRGRRPAPAPAGAPGRSPETAPPPTTAVVEAVAVLPSGRGEGIGRALVEAFLDAAAGAGTASAELVTKTGAGGASDFYTVLGWQEVDVHRDIDGDEVRRFRTEPGKRRSPRPADVRGTGTRAKCA